MRVHICAGTNPRYAAMVRDSGCRKYQLVGSERAFAALMKAIAALMKAMLDTRSSTHLAGQPMSDDEKEAEIFARMDTWRSVEFGLHEDCRFLRRRLDEVRAAHDRRVTELLEANNREVERGRKARRDNAILIADLIDLIEKFNQAWVKVIGG